MAGDDTIIWREKIWREKYYYWREKTKVAGEHNGRYSTPISKLPIGITTFLRRVYVENEFLVSEVTGTIIIWALYNIQSKGIVTECIEIEPSQVQHSFEWN